jgi:hypothetical protein
MASSPARWEHPVKAGVVGLVPHASGLGVLRDSALTLLDEQGTSAGELPAASGATAAAKLADVWWIASGDSALVRASKGKPARFADEGGAIAAIAVNEEAVAVAREGRVELWSHAGKRKWSADRGAIRALAFAGSHLALLGEDGCLVFVTLAKGEEKGTVRLASTDPVARWRLARVDANHVVLALGEWLVLVSAVEHKVVRRVRAAAVVESVAADPDWVVAGLDDGRVQVVQVGTGEPRLEIAAHGQKGVRALALTKTTLYTAGADGKVKAWDRTGFEAGARARAPVTAMASRGSLVAAGDRAGKVRILEDGREVATLPLGTAITAVHFTREDAVVAVTAQIVVRAEKPWKTPKPIALRAPATAFASDDTYAFVAHDHGGVDVYDLGKGELVTSYALSDAPITALCRLAGSLLVVGTASTDGRVFLVDVALAKVVHRIEAHEDAFGVTCLGADARGRIVASGSDDGTVAILDPVKGRLLARLRVRETPVAIAFEASGRRFGCTFADGTAAVVTLGKQALVLDLGLRGASQVAWGNAPVFGLVDGRVEPFAADA